MCRVFRRREIHQKPIKTTKTRISLKISSVSDNFASPHVPPSSDAKISWFWPLAVLVLLKIGGPFLPIPNATTAFVGAIFFTFVYVGAVVVFALAVVLRQLKPLFLIEGALGCASLWAIVNFLALPYVERGFRAMMEVGAAPTTSQILLRLYTETVQDLALLGAATFLGALLAKMIRHANMLGPIGVMIALIDIWGVLFGGIVAQMLTNEATKPLAEKAMTSGPNLGGIGAAHPDFAIPVPAIGVGDFLFLALLLAVVVNFGMNWRASAKIMWIAVSLALLLIIQPFFPVPHLPGLLFLGLGAVAPNLKYFSYSRDELFALLYAGIFVVILTVALYLGFSAALPKN